MKKLTSLVILLAYGCLTFAQNNWHKGTDFWLGFQENIFTPELTVRIAAGRNTTGTIQIPMNGWSQDFSITADSIQEIMLPDFAMAQFSEFPEPRGIHITTSDSVTVVAIPI